MRPLIADGGQVTFLRDLAAYSWGKWAVEWPETVPEDQRPKPTKDDRDFGYVAKLGKNPGRMGRRFTRSDVSITAAEYTAEGKPIQHSGFSDVEDVLDAAQKRVGSDVFIERDITRAGLNGNVPYVDFDIDDVVPVLIWGKTLNLPVTSIQEVTQEGAVIDWQIHVGGELISNDLARERANQDIERAIAQERRERQDAVSTVDSKASSAVSTADSANVKSDQALKAATDADGTIQQKLDEQRRLSSEFSVEVSKAESAADRASQAFDNVDSLVNSPDGEFRRGVSDALAAQDDVNRKQQEINATQENINLQQSEINTAQAAATKAAINAATDAKKATDAVSTTTRIVNAQQDSAIKLAQNAAYLQAQTAVQVVMTRNNQFVDNDLISGYLSSESWGIGGTKLSKVTFTAKGDWAGQLAVQIITTSGDVDYKNYGVGPGHRGTSYSTEGPVDIEGVVITIQIHYGNSPRKFAIVTNPAQPIISENGGVKMCGFQVDSGIYRNVIEGNPVDVRTSGHLQFPSLTVKPDSPVYKLSTDLKSATRVNAGVSIPAGTWILADRDPDNLTRVVEFST